jgi:hypothetical protein
MIRDTHRDQTSELIKEIERLEKIIKESKQ